MRATRPDRRGRSRRSRALLGKTSVPVLGVLVVSRARHGSCSLLLATVRPARGPWWAAVLEMPALKIQIFLATSLVTQGRDSHFDFVRYAAALYLPKTSTPRRPARINKAD